MNTPTIPFLPCADDSYDPAAPQKSGPMTLGAGFAYIGEALTADAFRAYVQSYNFGSIPPSYLVIHNTANPDASWAPLGSDPNTKWDRNETGLTIEQIKVKRKAQLDGIKDYYVSLGWPSGPHLFVDERWIWLFSPMYDVGTHAKAGNSYRDSAGTLHYSIGIETVGFFGAHGWPASMQQLLQVAVQSLQSRLGNFQITYTPAATNRPDLHDHSISFHNDYNKPACPGSVITPAYAIPILSSAPPPAAHARYMAMGVPVYEREDCTGPLWGYLHEDEVVTIDVFYQAGTIGHLADKRGFIKLDPSMALVP